MRLLLGSLVAEVNGIEFSLDDGETKLASFSPRKPLTLHQRDRRRCPALGVGPIQYFPAEVDGARRRVRFRRRAAAVGGPRSAAREHGAGRSLGPGLCMLDAGQYAVLAPELRRGQCSTLRRRSVRVGGGVPRPVGAGKTTAGTLARLAGAELISEELTCVALTHTARVCALPFRQKYKLRLPTRDVPAAGVLRPPAGERDAIEPLPRASGSSSSSPTRSSPCATAPSRCRSGGLRGARRTVPVRRLHFRKTPCVLAGRDRRLRATGAP